MLPNRSITSRRVRVADLVVRGMGVRNEVRRLEKQEPELADYLMERSSKLFMELNGACPSYRTVKDIHQETVLVMLACIEAVRRSA